MGHEAMRIVSKNVAAGAARGTLSPGPIAPQPTCKGAVMRTAPRRAPLIWKAFNL